MRVIYVCMCNWKKKKEEMINNKRTPRDRTAFPFVQKSLESGKYLLPP